MSPSVPLQIVIASIMCSYNKEDWTELAKMAEVKVTFVKTTAVQIFLLNTVNQFYSLRLYFAINRKYTGFYNQDVCYLENNIPETYEDSHGKKNLPQQSSHKLTNMNKSWFSVKNAVFFYSNSS